MTNDLNALAKAINDFKYQLKQAFFNEDFVIFVLTIDLIIAITYIFYSLYF